MFDEIRALEDLDENTACLRLAEMLNIDQPLNAKVLQRVREDKKFANYLVMLRDAPSLQQSILDNVDKGWTSRETPSTTKNIEPETHSSLQLAGKAAKSIAKWGASGFSRISQEDLAARLAACHACPHLAEAPKSVVYQGLKVLGSEDQRVCGKCGCTASRKARISTETCPDLHPEDATLNRWSQPVSSTS